MSDKKIDFIYEYNMAEDVREFIGKLSEEDRIKEVMECALLYSGRQFLDALAIFKLQNKNTGIKINGDLYYVTPFKMDEAYVDYACALMDFDRNKVHIISPNEKFEDHKGNVSEDLLRNKEVLGELNNLERFLITSYCVSNPFYNLFEHFGDKAIGIDVTPRADWENVKEYGNKPGIRTLIERLNDPNIMMAPGRIFRHNESNLDDIIDHGAIELENVGKVFKIKQGHGGVGVKKVYLHEVNDLNLEQRKDYLRKVLIEDYWNHFDVVVEDLVDIDDSIVRDPNVEVRINQDGKVEVLYVCGMRVVDGQYFVGVEFGNGVMDEKTERKLRYIGETLGQVYSDEGYRGHFEFDCFYDKGNLLIKEITDKNLLVTESNMRRTGGTFAYNFAIEKFGDEYMNHYYLTNSVDEPLVYGHTFTELNNLLISAGINYTDDNKFGVVLTSPDGYDLSNLSYMIVADTRMQANGIELKLNEAFQQLN